MDYGILDSFWFILLYAVCETAAMVLAARVLLHYFQLESYQFRGYFKTVARQWSKAVVPGFILMLGFSLPALVFVFVLGMDASSPLTISALAAIQLILGFVLYRKAVKTPQKKKFALTARMKRLYAALALVSGLAVWLNIRLILLFDNLAKENKVSSALSTLLCDYRPSFFLPLLVALAGVLALPIERLIFHLYFRDAEKKLLENPRLIRIGITGSYGKTSTKFILAEILSQKYNVLATPASFNTPMGVTRIIRERLAPSHQIFIGEMGARHVGVAVADADVLGLEAVLGDKGVDHRGELVVVEDAAAHAADLLGVVLRDLDAALDRRDIPLVRKGERRRRNEQQQRQQQAERFPEQRRVCLLHSIPFPPGRAEIPLRKHRTWYYTTVPCDFVERL